ncbi:hypothetical protein ACF1BU_06840 [Streptomyces sp. NPDC014724]|uniref:hypothetical protein n=1 Tax=unclassified Streptomyces TaxID=2593676 RepID=UPI0036FAB97C
MTQTPTAPAHLTAPAPPAPTGRARAVLRALAIAACLPYVSLKAAWIAGSHVGVPADSTLLDHRTAMLVANSASVLLDCTVVVLALLLTRPWGRRVPAWLLTVPMWVATGLLLPITTGFPLQLLVKAFGGTTAGSGGHGRPFLDEWVFGVVYTGFIVQGLTLGALFVLYARDRWSHLWRGRLSDLPQSPTGPALRVVAVVASLLALVPGAVHLLWATGSTAGLNEARIADRTSDFYALEAVYTVFTAVTVVGVLLLALRRRGALALKVPLALAWGGSGVLGCWGGYLCLLALGPVDDIADRPSAGMQLTYAVQMLVGILVAALGAYFFAERAAASRPAGPSA